MTNDLNNNTYPRDLIGYGDTPPDPKWPNNSRLAVQFVLNIEEGAERSILHGDDSSENFLAELANIEPWHKKRHMSVESIYEYGSRVGVWRILNLFREKNIPITLFTVGMAALRHPQIVEQALKDNHEICSHGYRWWDYSNVPIELEREHIFRAVEAIKSITGDTPLGWYTGRTSENTRKLIAETKLFSYDADDYNDDLPFWSYPNSPDQPHLVIPYSLLHNDMRFCSPYGFITSEHFFSFIKDAFDTLYQESEKTPRMMSIGLHPRIIGQPARFKGLQKIIEYICSFQDVWLCRRIDIANHWIKNHQPSAYINRNE